MVAMRLKMDMTAWYFGLLFASSGWMHRGDAFCHMKLKVSSSLSVMHQPSTTTIWNEQRYLHRRRGIATSIDSSASSSDDTPQSPRSKLRQLTGFSLTALRTTLRAATGFSLTAFRTTLRAATGISLSQSISGTLRRLLEVLSPSLRYFLQPLLIMYYAPLLCIRYYMVGPSRQYVEESQRGHEKVVEGWRKAVKAAEMANSEGYWPVHLNGEHNSILTNAEIEEWYLSVTMTISNTNSNVHYLPYTCTCLMPIAEDGTITTSLPPDPYDLDLADGIEKSVAAAVTTDTTSETSSAT